MGRALELLSGRVTAPGTTLTALTMNAGNSLNVRNAADGSRVELIQAWVDSQGSDIFRIRSPLMHDNVQGLRFRHVSSEVDPLMPDGFIQPLQPQDTLVVELAGSATAGDIENAAMLIYYEDLPGVDGRFMTPEEVKEKLLNLVTVENTLSLGTAGGYSGEEAIDAEFSLLKANVDYALLGYHVSAECAAVRWRGADTGNMGVGGPRNEASKQLTSRWFVFLSEALGVGLIPVFNASNASAFLLDGVQDENGADVIVTSILAELSTG